MKYPPLTPSQWPGEWSISPGHVFTLGAGVGLSRTIWGPPWALGLLGKDSNGCRRGNNKETLHHVRTLKGIGVLSLQKSRHKKSEVVVSEDLKGTCGWHWESEGPLEPPVCTQSVRAQVRAGCGCGCGCVQGWGARSCGTELLPCVS